MTRDDSYSEVADEQLDALEQGPDPDLYNAVLDACELVFRLPAYAQAKSTPITTPQGIVFRLPVVGYPHKVFWSSDRPRIEAILPNPLT